MRVTPLESKVLLGTCNKVRFGLVKLEETSEIQIAAIHHIVSTWCWNKVIQNIHIVHFPVRNKDKFRNVPLKIE